MVTLGTLPVDIKLLIMDECDPRTFLSLAEACCSFYRIHNTPHGARTTLTTLGHRMGRAGWFIYLLNKSRRRWNTWEALQRQGFAGATSAQMFQQTSVEDLVVGTLPISLDQRFPGNYNTAGESISILIRKLYSIVQTAEYFFRIYQQLLDRRSYLEAEKRRRNPVADVIPMIPGLDTRVHEEPACITVLSAMEQQEFEDTLYEYWISARLFRSHSCKSWSAKLKGPDSRWLDTCQSIFGDREAYDPERFRKIRAMREFIGQTVGRQLIVCDNWDFEEQARAGIEPKTNVLKEHIRAFIYIESLDVTNYSTATEDNMSSEYIRWIVKCLDLPGVQRVLRSGIQATCETLTLVRRHTKIRLYPYLPIDSFIGRLYVDLYEACSGKEDTFALETLYGGS
ncbi:hypothetical protein TWF730_002969 [Orbilia blumenaviensis]|uniref:F-box domain-containing protein n=1 Tax=Orbilia blumenaviensis TaxID=1796055 RepID=A0AAV9UB67_9PEZI